MRRGLDRMALALPCLLLLAAPVRSADLIAALSSNLVAITTGFSGTDVLLFGTIDSPGDVVVVVRGPDNHEVVRRKGRKAGIWMNEAELVFGNVPGFYAIAASRPLEEFLPEQVAVYYEIGVENLRLTPTKDAKSAKIADFREALLRNKRELGLYAAQPERIIFIGQRLFRTDMHVPANAPVGSYTVQVFLVRNGDVVSAQITPLFVSKVGFEANVFDLAHRYSLAYGVLAILIAGMAGWGASVMFRKG